VFLDTVGLLALWDRSDQWLEPAEHAFRRLSADRAPLVSSRFVLLECANAAARKPYRAEADELRACLEASGSLLEDTAEGWKAAWAGYRRGEADGAGVVDQLSFRLMRRLGIRHAFTNDRHFRAAGLITLF
jgi:predicted nucleic acid-binding protein